MESGDRDSEVTLAELLAAFSLATDLGFAGDDVGGLPVAPVIR